MGELRKRGSIWWVRYYRAGRRHEESSGSTKKTEAKKLLALREGAIAQGLAVSAKSARVTFEEAAAAVVKNYRTKGKRTTASVERRVRLHLEPFFGGRRLAYIVASDATAYAEHRQGEGAANSTINRELAVLRRAFKLAKKDHAALNIPAFEELEEDNVREGFFERDEFEAVRGALPGYLKGLATLAYLTGFRKGETLGLKWKNIQRKDMVIRLEGRATKNKKAKTLPYGALPELVDVIEAQWREHRRLAAEGVLCPWVFNRNGEKIGSFVKAWKSACKAAGCPGKLFHDFRRTAVRNLVRAGVPDKIAMDISGHKTRSVFDRYDIVNEDDLRAGLGKLADAAEASNDGATGTEKGQSGRVAQMQSS